MIRDIKQSTPDDIINIRDKLKNTKEIIKIIDDENSKFMNNLQKEEKELKNLNKFSNLKHLDLSDNPTITEIPESLIELPNLETIKLWNCHINKFSKSTEKIFWMNQNYRYFTGYNDNDR